MSAINKTTNKTMKVLEHLKKYGSITSWEAIQKYGATRLSAIIYNLRKNHVITSDIQEMTDRYGDNTRFAKYVYVGEIATDNEEASGSEQLSLIID